MRKRKLYLSEFLKRNINKKCEVTIIENEIPITYEDVKQANYHYDKEQIKEWYYSEYYGLVIFIE